MNRIPSLTGPRGCAPARTGARAIQAGVVRSIRHGTPARHDEARAPDSGGCSRRQPTALVDRAPHLPGDCLGSSATRNLGVRRLGPRASGPRLCRCALPLRASHADAWALVGRARDQRRQRGVSGRVVPSPRNPGPFRPRACACAWSIQRTRGETAARPAWGPPSYPFDSRTPQGVVARGDRYRPRVRRAMRVHGRRCGGYRRGEGGA